MGVTVTTHLGLIKPDQAEKIKEDLPTFPGWATQNESNCDAIDPVFRRTTHSWTPTWTTDVASNPVLGAGGFLEGKYIRLWPRMVHGYIRIFCGGAGFTTGTGLYRLSLPTTIAPELITMNAVVPVGKAYLHDVGTVATSTVFVMLYDTANNVFTFRRHDGDFWRSTAPITLAVNDRFSAFFSYPTSDA